MVLYSLYLLYMQTVPICDVEEALVSGSSNPIPDAQITASSWSDDTCAPRQARISNTGGRGAWLSSSTDYLAPELSMYIQVCSLVTTCIRVLPFKY